MVNLMLTVKVIAGTEEWIEVADKGEARKYAAERLRTREGGRPNEVILDFDDMMEVWTTLQGQPTCVLEGPRSQVDKILTVWPRGDF